MAAEVTLRTVEPTLTAVVAATTTWAEFPSRWKPMLDQVWGFLADAPAGLRKDGHNVMLYKDDAPNVEVGVQVTGPFAPVGDVRPSTLPGGVVATTTHTGPIHEIGATHDAVCAWCAQQGHRLAGPRWEIYGDPEPATGQFPVDVFWLLVAS
jgi:effector-binding domain-containing protein